MEMDRLIRQAILPVVPICEPNLYDGEEQTYCVFDYEIIPWMYADGVPISFNYSTQIHLYLPVGKNPSALISGITTALSATGLPAPEVTNASDGVSQHYVFDFSHIVFGALTDNSSGDGTGGGSEGGGGECAGDPTLPAGYVRCGYIRFSGEQIVDTGIVCNQNTTIKVVFTREIDDAMYLYGVVNTNNTASVTAYLSSGGSWRFGNRSASRGLTTSEELIHTATVSKAGIEAISPNNLFGTVNDFKTIGSLVIGSVRNANGTVGSPQYIGKVLLFVMLDGDKEVLHLSPVVSVDGVYRFYDEVSNKFHDSITETPLDGGNL